LLQAELERQGFKLAPTPCPGQPNIKRATISIPDVIRLNAFPYRMDAAVYWAIDANGRITWVSGIVSFMGI
jgi:hypothetical protein